MHLALKSAMSRIPYTNKVGETLGSIADPAAAYSLRALNGGDPMVARVRRSSDDAEKDFTASDVSGGALVDWVGSGNDGFVSTWYDQLGNDNHATQSTVASQPKIVDVGALVSDGIKFNGTNNYFTTPVNSAASINGDMAVIAVATSGGQSQNGRIYSARRAGDTIFEFLQLNDEKIRIYDGVNNRTTETSPSISSQYLTSNFVSSGTISMFINGADRSPSTNTINITTETGVIPYIGAIVGTANHFNGTIYEIIIYDSDQSANRAAIETNINNYYDIY